MSGQYFGERFNPSDSILRPDNTPISPVASLDPFADKVPVDAALIHETPMGGTLVAVGPLNEQPDDAVSTEEPVAAIPMDEPFASAIMMNEPLTSAILMNKPFAPLVPVYEAPVKELPVETVIPVIERIDEANMYQAAPPETIVEDWGSKPMPYTAPVVEPIVPEAPFAANAPLSPALLNREESEQFRTQWNEIQGKFVDEPRTAVQQADALVAQVIEQITQMFANEHSSLESQWSQGKDVSTEDLRKTLQRYRSFFNRLVV